MFEPNFFAMANGARFRCQALGLTEHFTEADAQALFEQSNYCCMACGRSNAEVRLSIDHVVPVSRAGKNTPDNLQVLCKSCNSQKYDKIIDYRVSPPLFIAESVANGSGEPAKKRISLMVRLPDDLHAEISELASKERRSLNSQLLALVKDALAMRRTLNGQRDRQQPATPAPAQGR